MPEIQFIFRLLGEKWEGKAVKIIFFLSPHTPDAKKSPSRLAEGFFIDFLKGPSF